MGWKTIKKANALNFQKELETLNTNSVSESLVVEEVLVEESVSTETTVKDATSAAEEMNEIINTEETAEESSQLEISLPDIGEIPVIETSLETADLSDTIQEVKKTSKKKKS